MNAPTSENENDAEAVPDGFMFVGVCLPSVMKTGSIEEVRALQAAGLIRYDMRHPDAIGPREWSPAYEPDDWDEDEESEW